MKAQIPDLTNGDLRLDNLYWNLGPTGMSGWFYRPDWTAKYAGWNTEFARQIEVITVDGGSPADGILQIGDVILGADGTGADPVNFTSDARKAFAYAIADAEARSPATLKLLVWRAGTTSTMSLTLETLGAYSATAPYNCPKSAAVLEKGLDAVMASGGTDEWKFSLITLLAGNDPSNPDNAARMARAQQEAYALILTAEQIAEYTAPFPLSDSKVAWTIGFKLTAMAEYYLHTGDPAVYDSLRAYAIAAANGQSMFGTSGHQFAKKNADGSVNGPYGIGYGVVNSANMQCFLGLTLAKQAGVTDQAVLDAVERAGNFYSAYVDRGTIPYGEHEPGIDYGDNGKSGIAALCFKAEGTRNYEANYYATLAASAAHNLDAGHQGPYLNYLWTPLGVNAGGEEAMAAFFAEQSWRFDLARNYDGTFTYNSYQNGGQYGYGGPTWSGKNFQIYQAMLLPYAAPLRETYLTGKNTAAPADWLSTAVLDDVQISSGYDATNRTTPELLADLEIWSPVTRIATAAEIGKRTSEHATLLPTLHAMATDINATLQSRMGACRVLGQIRDDSSVSLLVGLLTDADTHIKWEAATALREFSESALLPEVDAVMTACIAEGKPVLPIDTEDPIHLTHMKIVQLLFSKMLRNHDLVGIDRDLLIPAIRAGAVHPMGGVRGDAGRIYSKLSREEVESLADVLVDGTLYEAPADRMFSASVRMSGLNAIQSHNFAEGVRMAMILTLELNSKDALDRLIGYAGNALLVEPDHQVLEWLDVLEASDSGTFTNASNWPDPGTHNLIQWVRDAITGDPGPYEKPEAFKRIYTVYADDATLTLPDSLTGLHVEAYDFAQGGDTVYTWRKVHGAGEVSFYPNGTAAARDTTVVFDGSPGQYLFEVKMSDSLGFSEVTQTVAVTLEKVGGGLDPNLAPTADDQSVTPAQGIPTAIVLTGSDPEGYALNYTVTSGPSYGTLSGTAPSLVYTAPPGYTGSDSISFEVMDSEGQVASGTVSITVGAAAPVGLAIYEPFEGYPQNPTDINGFAGTSEIGFAAGSTWTSGAGIYTDDTAPIGFPAGGYTYGPLPTTGSKLWLQGMNAPGLSRPIHPDALTNSGLLADGATLWFSALIGADDTHLRGVQIALANASFGTSKNFILDNGAELGTGLGFEFDSSSFHAAQFFDATQSTPLRGDFDEFAAGKFVRYGDLRLVVGKISWGADSDLVELYLPLLPDAGAGIVLPDKPSSTLVANVDQSKFDVLAVSRGTNLWVDEIRVGATLQSVLMGTVDAGGAANDGVAPAPDPMTFAVAPFVTNADSITMTATPAYDPLGVEYYFTCTAGAGNDSGWQDSTVYTDTGLTPGIAYSYTVKARDKTPGLNETAASSAASATIPSLGTVPGVVGIAQASAESVIVDAGMAVGAITTASSYSLTVPAGYVLTQTPTGSSAAAYGSAVNLEISIGQDPALPTLASVDIVDDQGGMHVTLPGTIIYTLTFSQDMDVTTIDAGDFFNLSGVPIIISAINEISPGVVTVEVTPNTIEPGSLILAIAQGAVIKDALGNNLNTSSAIADDNSIPLVRPANYVPIVDAGVDQTIEINSAQPWSPAAISSVAWFDAADFATITQSGGTVSKWDDKSGNGNHASQGNTSTQPSYNSSDPKLNNLPTIGYDQAFKTLLTNSFTAQRAYVVTYYDQAIFGSWHAAILGRNTGSRFLSGQSGQNYLNSGHANTGTAYQNGDRAVNLVDGSNPAVLPMSASVWTVAVNTPTFDQWVLLGGTQGYSGWENGALGEVILTDGTESLETQQKIEGYLAHKWGLEANLPPVHPFRYQEPQLKAATATLDATVLDYDSDPLEALWSLVSGPYAVNFSDADLVDGTASFAEPGTYTLLLTADDGKVQGSDEMTVTVNINGIWLFIDLPQISESGGTSSATVFRDSTAGDLLVNLSSSDTSELIVPATVTIPDGQSQASFTLTAQDDALTDGIQTVSVTATSSGNPDRTATINVLDDEAVLMLAIAASSIGEGDGVAATTGIVTRNTDTSNELVVYLSSDDTSEVAVPASVTIPAGQASSPAFPIDAVNDAVVDGTQTVALTAIAPGYASGTATLDVADDPTVTLTLSVGSGVGTTSGPGAMDPDAGPFAITASPGQSYVFDQWRVTSGPATVNDASTASALVTASADSVLVADFVLTSHPVTYNANGSETGDVPTDASSPYNYGSSVTVLGNTGALTRANHSFTGWNTASDGSGTAYVAEDSFTITEDTVLYAQWAIDTHTVTYSSDLHDSGLPPVDGSNPYDYGSTVTVLDNTGLLALANYSFAGWNTANDGSGLHYLPGETFTITGDTTLHAQWVLDTHTVIYDGNGSDVGEVPVDAASPYNYGTTVAVLDHTESLSLTGHTFAGWNTASDGSGTAYAPAATFTLLGDTVLYAQWTINSYTVTYDGNGSDGGTVPVDASSPYEYNTEVTVLGNTGLLSRVGHTFAGWNTASDGSGTSYVASAPLTVVGETVLYAQWDPETYTITYNGNNNDSGTAPVDANTPYVQGATVTVLGNTGSLSKAGFSFAGWNTVANGLGTTYAPGATFTMPGANVELHAIWNAPPIVNAGPDQTIQVVSGVPWSPANVATTLAWYDAADVSTLWADTVGGIPATTTIAWWEDKSGNSRHLQATSSPSTGGDINGVHAIKAADGDYFSVAGFGTGTYDIFFVMRGNNSGNTGDVSLGGNTNNSYLGIAASGSTSNSNILRINGTNEPAGAAILFNGETTQSVSTRGALYNEVGNQAFLVRFANIPVLTTPVKIMEAASNSWEFVGDAGEILFVASPSPEEAQKLEGYLAHKWGLAANLANDHPYKASPPDGAAATTTLAGSASDPENDALATQWTLTTGPAAPIFQDDTATNTDVTFMQEGIYTFRLAADDGFGSAFDDVTITVDDGGDTTAPTLSATDILDDQGGADVIENSLVTYTVTFSEDMDAATVEASDFGNAGSVPITVGAVTETSPGIFSVEVMPTGTGTLQLQVKAAAILNDLSGNSLDTSSAIADDTTINVVAPPNNAPVFTVDPFSASDATIDTAYSASISDAATDIDGDTLSYTRVSGPAWLSVAIGGELSGTPTVSDEGTNTFIVRVSDGIIATPVEATLNITVNAAPTESGTPILIDWSTASLVANPAVDGKYWNSLGAPGTASDLPTTALVDTSNVASGISVAVDNTGNAGNFTGAGFGGTGIAGPTGADPFDEGNAVNDGIYTNYNANGTSLITFTGLAPSTEYAFAAIGGRASGGTDGVVDVLQGSSGFAAYTLLNNGTVLNFTVTSSATGTIQFEFSEIVDDTDGGTSATWNALSLTPPTPFEAWAGEGSSPGDDSNGDGISNGLAWVLGASDSSSDASALLPTSDSESDPEYYIFTYRRADVAHNDSNTSISVVYGENLSVWSPAVHDGLNVIITETDDGYATGVDRVEVKISWDLVSGNKIFTRLRVEISP